MTVASTFHLIGYSFGFAAFLLIYLSARPALIAHGTRVHLMALLSVHLFRYFGLTALLPGVFDLKPAGFSDAYLTQIMAGDVLAAILAIIAMSALIAKAKWGLAAVWVFNVIGTLDYLNAAARVTPSIHDANLLGPLGWIVMTVLLPAWLISHAAIFVALVKRDPAQAH